MTISGTFLLIFMNLRRRECVREIGALVVDDFADTRRVVKGVLRRMGVREIFEAADGLEALGILSGRDEHEQPVNHNIQLVVCDIHMPKMNGLELLNEIRSSDAFKELTVIMITAYRTEQNILESVKLGADAFVIKPYTLQILEDKIREALKRKGRRVQ
jgi:two-component system chemotaxis response regulator CheY